MSLGSHSPLCLIPTTRPDEARRFYEGVLGLRFVEEDPFAMVFHLGAANVRLRVFRAPAFEPLPFTLFGWEVPEIEKMIDELSGKGVEFLRFGHFEQDARGIWRTPGAAIAWFKDPDGNTLSLSQRLG